jgi:hypothetical protein
MNYAKPEVALINRAINVIKGQNPKVGSVPDALTPIDSTKHQTAAAYEADE